MTALPLDYTEEETTMTTPGLDDLDTPMDPSLDPSLDTALDGGPYDAAYETAYDSVATSRAAFTAADEDLFAQVDSAIAQAEGLDSIDGQHSDRHGSLVGLCAKFHAIMIGRAAAEILDDYCSLPEEAGLWVAPSWAWLFSRVNVGRKDRAADGSRLRLPVRMEWSTGPISLVTPGRRKRHNWVSAGMGNTGSGSLLVGVDPSLFDDQVTENEAGVPTGVTLRLRTRRELEDGLQRLVEEGNSARWEALLWLEPYVDRALRLAHANVANELSVQWGTHRTLLDETKLKAIADQMLLGDENHPGKVAQMMERCLKPDTFRRVEPVKYIKESLRRDANTEVRRALGDPHIGAKVRRVAHELGTNDLDAIIETYRERYPNDRLSKDRAEAALSVSPDAMAAWWGLSTGPEEG